MDAHCPRGHSHARPGAETGGASAPRGVGSALQLGAREDFLEYAEVVKIKENEQLRGLFHVPLARPLPARKFPKSNFQGGPEN